MGHLKTTWTEFWILLKPPSMQSTIWSVFKLIKYPGYFIIPLQIFNPRSFWIPPKLKKLLLMLLDCCCMPDVAMHEMDKSFEGYSALHSCQRKKIWFTKTESVLKFPILMWFVMIDIIPFKKKRIKSINRTFGLFLFYWMI